MQDFVKSSGQFDSASRDRGNREFGDRNNVNHLLHRRAPSDGHSSVLLVACAFGRHAFAPHPTLDLLCGADPAFCWSNSSYYRNALRNLVESRPERSLREAGAGSSNLLTPTNNINCLASVSGLVTQHPATVKSIISPSQVHYRDNLPKVLPSIVAFQNPHGWRP